jgi:hypothetical protein
MKAYHFVGSIPTSSTRIMINFNDTWIDKHGIIHMNGSDIGNYVEFTRNSDGTVWTKVAYDYDIELNEVMDQLESEWLEEIFLKNT